MGLYQRDSRGIAKILKNAEHHAIVDEFAEAIAGDIAAANPGVEPGVHSYETDRAAAAVVVAGGRARQARDGIFSRACAAHGVEMVGR